MKNDFEMSMFGEIKFFVGLQINQMKHGIFITQSKYVKEILKTFGMENSNPIGTPMVTGHKLSKNDGSVEFNQTLYRSIIHKFQSSFIAAANKQCEWTKKCAECLLLILLPSSYKDEESHTMQCLFMFNNTGYPLIY